MVCTLEQGDIVYLDFDQQAGHEQRGRRPAIVVSNKAYHTFVKAAIVCPITNTNRGYPTQIPLDDRTQTTGVVMCDQVKALDAAARNVQFVEAAPRDIVQSVLDIISAFF